ncbi:MAG: SAM-dependent methyltransferase [Gammaproteobacteria bacterium]
MSRHPKSRVTLPEPPDELKQLSDVLRDTIRQEIRAEGMMPFSRYMEMALYQPGLGYYSAGLHKFGARGDFITSPELGSLFAACMARQIEEVAEHLGKYDILEIGAGSGRLAADILQLIDEPFRPHRYLILERSADLRKVQREHLTATAPQWSHRVEWLDRPPEEAWQGVILANEVIDALAVERFRVTASGVEQICVVASGNGFGWSSRPAPAKLATACGNLGVELQGGYQSELNLQLPGWLSAVTRSMHRGLALFIDYGYPRREYYLHERNDGTLICHYRHRAHDDVFFWPGLQDITAFVDFTALAEAADQSGLQVEGYTNQVMFLLGCGLEQVLAKQVARSEDGGMSLNAQTRQLTMPGMMGERFQVMGLGRELDFPLSGFKLLDLSHRL